MPPPLRVLVVGASIAGPSVAYWLARTGAQVTVIERFPKLRENGHNIDIRSCGVSTMRRIPGMEAAVRANAAKIDGMCIVGQNGKVYGSIGRTGDPDQQSLVSEFEITRGDLGKVLYDLTKDDPAVKYVFDEQVSAVHQSDTTVKVEFANGQLPTSEYDLVVAADGATSRTRALGLGCGVRTHVISTNSYAAYMTTKDDYVKGSTIGRGLSAPGGRMLFAGLDTREERNTITMMHISPESGPDVVTSFREALSKGDQATKAFVADRFKDIGWISNQAIKSMMETDDFYASENVKVVVPSLFKGRFAMVGDAGHAAPFTGAGTSLAMTGAYLLAGEIGKHKGDLAAGLAGYEEKMRPIVDKLQQIPPGIRTVMAPQTWWGCAIRNYMFWIVTASGLVNLAQRLFGGAFADAKEYPLPDYEWER